MQKKLNVLLVEDNPADLVLLNNFIEVSGISFLNTYVAETLNSARKILVEQQPDLIFLDLFLPDSDALDTFNTINNAAPTIPIIILSGLADSSIALQAIQSPAGNVI